MLKNYFVVAWRNFRRNKLFSLINVIGLSIGISSALVIFLIVHHDLSFDKFQKDGDRFYRTGVKLKFTSGDPFTIDGVQSPLPEAVKKEVPGIDEVIAFHEFNDDADVSIPSGNSKPPARFKKQEGIIYTERGYFDFLGYQWLAGSPQTALKDPFKVVLSEERAHIYFPAQAFENIIGKTIVYNDSITAVVSGVVSMRKENSDFIFKEFISLATIPASGLKYNHSWNEWSSVGSSSQMWLKLSAGTSPKTIEAKLGDVLKNHIKRDKDDKSSATFVLQPLSDLHFDTQFAGYGERTAHMPTLYGLLSVAAFLVILGCINFINLTTAQSSQRSKEIGIRKTLGSSRAQLRFQFLAETFLITSFATVLSVIFTPFLLKVFADFIPPDLHIDILHQPAIPLFLVGLLLAVSFLSGFYPAMVLSGFNPVQVLKGQGASGSGATRRAWLRKGLTISQFFIAQVFIMATLITVKQIHYVINADMGFKKDAIISFRVPFNWGNFHKPDGKRLVLLDELKKIPGIAGISLANTTPAAPGWNVQIMHYVDGKKEIETDVQQKNGDSNYLNLFHLKLLAGRNVEQSDTTKEYLINETYMHILGFKKPEDALNKMVNGHPIVGVMADFHQESLHGTIKPLAYSGNLNFSYGFNIALQPRDAGSDSWKTTISSVEKEFKKLYPEENFSYQFLDETIAKFYKSEQAISQLLKWAAGLAIFISCLGLLGLVMFTTNLRIKEIGVRKILGASVTQLVSLLSKDFIILVLIAFVIATPVAWWAMHQWLNNFAYKTSISWWLFAASGIIMVFIAVFTMSIQTVKAANANPVSSLRSE